MLLKPPSVAAVCEPPFFPGRSFEYPHMPRPWESLVKAQPPQTVPLLVPVRHLLLLRLPLSGSRTGSIIVEDPPLGCKMLYFSFSPFFFATSLDEFIPDRYRRRTLSHQAVLWQL